MIDLPDTEKVQQVIPTDHEAREIMNLLLGEALHFKIFYVLAIYTSCRCGELCALKWSDIIIQNSMTTMVVSRSLGSLLGCGVMEGNTKNGNERTYCHPQTILKHKAVTPPTNQADTKRQAWLDEQAHSFESDVKQRRVQPITLSEFAESWIADTAKASHSRNSSDLKWILPQLGDTN